MINTFYNEKFPILDVNKDFFLRKQLVKDAEAFFEYYTHPEVTRYILASNPRNLAEAAAEIRYCRNLFKRRCGIYWTLARKEDNYMIGAIGLYINNQHYRAEVCYDLSYQYWNQGIMTKAIKIIADFSFYHIPINRIEAVTLKENIASITTLKKVGFVREGTMKNYRYFNGQSHDVEMFAIITSRMQTQKNPFLTLNVQRYKLKNSIYSLKNSLEFLHKLRSIMYLQLAQGLLMRQPRALTPLFFTEMWERFGFYVTQSLLILYLTSALNFSDSRAYFQIEL